MKTYDAKGMLITINGVPLKGFGSIEHGKPPTDPAMRAFFGFGPVEVPYDSVSQAERRRMESDARLRAEERLRDWRRGR